LTQLLKLYTLREKARPSYVHFEADGRRMFLTLMITLRQRRAIRGVGAVSQLESTVADVVLGRPSRAEVLV
jgi:hypothetical protein